MNQRDRQVLEDIRHLLVRLDAAVVVRDPGSARAAESFDGLRKQLAQASKNRRSHQAHLLSLHESLQSGASLELVRDRVADFMTELGIVKSSDTTDPSFFDVVEGEGPELEVMEPAYVEVLENGQLALIRLGKARRITPAVPPLPEENATEQPDAIAVSQKSDPTEIGRPESPLNRPEDRRGSNRLVVLIGIACLVIGGFVGAIIRGESDQPPAKANTTIPASAETTTETAPSTTVEETTDDTTSPTSADSETLTESPTTTE
jgi:hypothetical protein